MRETRIRIGRLKRGEIKCEKSLPIVGFYEQLGATHPKIKILFFL